MVVFTLPRSRVTPSAVVGSPLKMTEKHHMHTHKGAPELITAEYQHIFVKRKEKWKESSQYQFYAIQNK